MLGGSIFNFSFHPMPKRTDIHSVLIIGVGMIMLVLTSHCSIVR